jgi:spermidine/putrescine transport system substrate-binding protein
MHDLKKLTRREFLLTSIASAASLSACTSSGKVSNSGNQLNIYSWADYLHPDTINNFQKRYGINVVYDTYASNEALLAKLQAGASSYDVVVPTSYMVRQLIKQRLLAELDKEKLANFKNLTARFQNPAYDPNCQHSVPYTWGTTGIGFNSSFFGGDASKYPHDWEIFWDKRLSGRITLLDDARETIGMSLKRRGHSYNEENHAAIEAACADLKIQKPLTMSYTSDQVIVALSSGDSLLSLAYSGDVYQAARDKADIKYVIPESGTSIWTDSLCIPASAPHKENAYLWLNYMLEPEVAASCANYTRYSTPNAKALSLIDQHLLSDKNLYPGEAMMNKCNEIGDVGQAIFFYDQMWTELKCS